MVIERAELRYVSLPLRTPFETSTMRETHKDCILVTVYSEGLRGWGEAPVMVKPLYSSETVETAWHVLRDFLIPLATTSSDPETFAKISSMFKGHQMAKAGLEAALWDLRCEREGIPLSKLLGGTRSEVEVGVSVGLEPRVASILDKVRDYRKRGYQRIKLKIRPGQDRELLAGFRRDHSDLPLQADANCAYRPEHLPHLVGFDEFDMLLLEQPFQADDWVSHMALQKQMTTSICLDESVSSVNLARQAIALEACRNINIKQARIGGLKAAIEVHDLCLEKGIDAWCGGLLETGIGRFHNLALASLPGFCLPGDISESARYFEQDILLEPIVLNNNWNIDVPDVPGGVDRLVCRSSLERYTERVEAF
jgi:o-succinylbenzoate synthase